MVPVGKIPISYNTSRDGQPVPEFTHSHCKRMFFSYYLSAFCLLQFVITSFVNAVYYTMVNSWATKNAVHRAVPENLSS